MLDLCKQCELNNCLLAASGRGLYPHTDAGVDVRRIFHLLHLHPIYLSMVCSRISLLLGGQFSVKDLLRSQLIVLGDACFINFTIINLWDEALSPFCGLRNYDSSSVKYRLITISTEFVNEVLNRFLIQF